VNTAEAIASTRERVTAHRNRDRLIVYAEPEDLGRRTELESDTAEWLQHYMPERFCAPFGEVHHKIIEGAERAIVTGTSVTAAAPRGAGKTSIFVGSTLKSVLSGVCRFPVVIGWKSGAGRELLMQWLTELSNNPRLLADYPCQCQPFWQTTQSTRLQGLLRELEPEKRIGCDVRKMDLTIILPDVYERHRELRHSALAGASINGSIKGLNVGLITGEALRPDIVLLDDPQDEETAQSPALVKKVIKKIDYGVRSLSGPRRRLAVKAAVTCVETDDVSHHLLTRQGTESIRIGQITAWPKGWDDEKSTTRALWDDWNRARIDGLDDLDKGKAAREFYEANKEAMIEGMAVSWEHRYQEGDEKRVADPDAFFAAMWDYYDLGEHAFMAERQNAPIKEGVTILELSPRDIVKRVDQSRKGGALPSWVRKVIAATDVNPSYALSTAIIGFGDDQRAGVIWYGKQKMSLSDNEPDAVKKAAIMQALQKHGGDIAKIGPIDLWVIDGGGSPQETVQAFAQNSKTTTGLAAITAFGRAWSQYRPRSKDRAYEQSFIRSKTRTFRWCIWNADYWRELAQKAWLGAMGAPGSCDLPRGRHDDFAEQICRESLKGKAEVAGTWKYVWHTAAGPHDYGDCMAMGFMGAALEGIGTGGQTKKPKRKARVVIGGRIYGGT
jgi:hypothetical protein